MISVAANIHCNNDKCQCEFSNTNMSCSSPLCQSGPNCLMYCSYDMNNVPCTTLNSTYLPITIPGNFTPNCTITTTTLSCILSSPSATSCILLALVILESIYNTIGMFFKSYIIPIMLPYTVLFLIYWMNEDIDNMILKLGRSEFGSTWEIDQLGQTVTDVQQLLRTDSLW